MCYSAQVIQVGRKLQRRLGLAISVDYDAAEKLFFRRLDDPSMIISRGFEANFSDPSTDQERRIFGAIEEHRSRTATKLERDLFSQKTRLAIAERSLKSKATKKAREDVRISSSKIESLTARLCDLRRSESMPQDNRIFPMVYVGIIIRQGDNSVLTPMRYFCRPAGKPAFYDKKFPGLYNARRDNLQKFWSAQFGAQHALMVVESFYENVRLQERNVVLQFTPKPPQDMLIACLYSHWTDANEPDVRGFAAITDEPPADIAAAGHDRCIINLRPEQVEAWLTPEHRSPEELQATLSDPAVSTFLHAVLRAA